MAQKPEKFNSDGKIEVVLTYDSSERTFWASQKQMAEMFNVGVNTINEHIKTIEKESGITATIRNFRIVQLEGNRKVNREVIHYNHKMILLVGFRCHSERALAYQEWATEVLFREVMQEKRDEEKESYKFLKKALCMSTDYGRNSQKTSLSFSIMQNMTLYAAAGATAAAILLERANAHKPNVGLTTFKGKKVPTKKDVEIAKNYLVESELVHMTKTSQAFMLAIEIATTGRKKHQYTMDEILQEYTEFLIKYHQEVLEPGKPFIPSEYAKSYAKSQREEYIRLMKQNLPAIQTGNYLPESNQDTLTEEEMLEWKRFWEQADESELWDNDMDDV